MKQSASCAQPATGRLSIIGSGPGSPAHLTDAARSAIADADILVGYGPYIDQLGDLAQTKEVLTSGMTREIDRCRLAIERARHGNRVALISGGDAGIYGMAGLVFELLAAEGDTRLAVEVIPGLSALQAAASRLGAPLMHDTAIISLSDLLTPWDTIRTRLAAAAAADFVIALYNPRSTRRTSQLEEARRLCLLHRPAATPVGIVRNACRPDEEVEVTTLGELLSCTVDMSTLVIIGNSSTFVDGAGRMVTPRGYENKREFAGTGQSTETAAPEPPSRTASPAALMVVGTASDVGKSAITAGLCRLLLRRGLRVAPFKSQNMALNAAVTPEGGEIGRAQASQAVACRIPPHTDMNPILLKPTTDTGSQVIVQGTAVGVMAVAEYDRYKPVAWEKVQESLERLQQRSDFLVMEGAGSIAEINLKDRDIANLAVARLAGNAPAILVADIERGGVFAQVVGSIELLEPWERDLIKGVVINRFRGDPAILEPGLKFIEQRCGIPVLGVVPWLRDLALPAEDSLALPPTDDGNRPADRLCVGVLRLPRISNFTDFEPLIREPDLRLCYLERPEQLAGLDLVILPGSKATMADLAWLRDRGFDRALNSFGGMILGVCGGYQMLGELLQDPDGVESLAATATGLGLLPVHTVLLPEKTTRLTTASPAAGAALAAPGWHQPVQGYEIHAGISRIIGAAEPFLRLDHEADGAVSADGRIAGSYLHGLFDDPPLREALLNRLRRAKGLPERNAAPPPPDPYDRLADHLASHLDIPRLLAICGLA
ncbi:cobyric acid synthase [Trichlorobacter ammonificans]|uniref:Cobyric acid synthase n=1 Tax=Trichlorobacter ammonificans TaxID=2916410 RepID=A0ABN8HKZ8_9BACT|nr:cobyric acid synthase [Trichlorobacter ammonificans]CAH2032025.1 Cobyric acid synthase [Trichlorobacter ammonificans]